MAYPPFYLYINIFHFILIFLVFYSIAWYNYFIDNQSDLLDKNKLTYGRGYVYSLQYHIVWCTKYRRPVLKDGIDDRAKELLYQMAEEYCFEIMAMEVMPDHILETQKTK